MAGWMRRVRSVWQALRGRPAFEADMDEEFRHHLELRTEHLVRSGLSPAEAARRARIEFGTVERLKEEGRASRGLRLFDELRGDLRFGARSLKKNPGFATVAVLTLGLGIGASTAMFTLVNSVLLRPLPFHQPERLVVPLELSPYSALEAPSSPLNFFAWRSGVESFEGLAGGHVQRRNLTGDGRPEELPVFATTANFFEVLGVEPRLGRLYGEGEVDEPVAVLSHRLWQRRFGGDPGIAGRVITLDGETRTVVAVLPPDFHSLGERVDVWLPTRFDVHGPGRFFHSVGRLRPGATLEQAQAEMEAVLRRQQEEYPQWTAGWGVRLAPLHEEVTAEARPSLLVLLGAVTLLLLIACANVASLLLARSAVRQKEMALRITLGATRPRLVRQTLVESLVLAGLAGLLGLALAAWGTRIVVRLLPADLALPRVAEIGVDGRVLAFAIGVSVLTGVLFGVAPALSGSAVRLAETLREAARGTTSGRLAFRKALVVAEVALAVVLLVAAGLVGRSLQSMLGVDPGVRVEQVLTLQLTLTGPRYQGPEPKRRFLEALLPRLDALPGARSVGAEIFLPLSGDKMGHVFFREDRPRPAPGEELPADVRVVAGDYFRTLGIPLLRGRTFGARDDEAAEPVFVVNQELAERFYPGEDPVGKPIALPWGEDITGRIVGVVGSVREKGLTEEPSPALYRAYAQMPFPQVAVVMRAEGEPLTLADAAASVVREIDPDQPIAQVRTMEQVVAETVARPRFNLYLLAGFAATALLLAAIGLYGILSFSVAQRRQEIAVRVALGARRGRVLRQVVGEGLGLMLLGLLVGLGVACLVTRVMVGLLFGVAPTDPPTLIAAAAFLVAVALLACWLPARRALRVSPMSALRVE